MALSPAAGWYEACARSDPALRFLVQIYDGTTTWSAVDGSCDQLAYPESVLDVSSVSVEVDPIERRTQVSSLDITVEDDWLRPILVNNRIKGQRIVVKIGAQEMAEGDFLGYFLGVIQDNIPDGDRMTVRLLVEDAFSIGASEGVVGYWIGIHGLEILDNILTTKLTNSVDAALVDTTSLDPSQAAHNTISHWVCARGGRSDYNSDDGVWTPTSARDLMDEISQLLYGNFVADEVGVMSFKRFDSTDAATFNWTTDDIKSFRQITVDENAINRVEISAWPNGVGEFTNTLRMGDTVSQGNLAYPGKSERIEGLQISTSWITETASLQASYAAASVAAFNITNGRQFSGSNQWDAGPQPAWAQASATKPIYLLINDEIIKATSLTFSGDGSVGPIDPADGEPDIVSIPGVQIVDGITRAYAGSAPAGGDTHTALSKIYDATVLVELAEAILARGAHGISIIEVETTFAEYENQAGDIGTVTHGSYLAYGKDGITSSDKWEIIYKKPDKARNRILWRLAAAGATAPTDDGGAAQWGMQDPSDVNLGDALAAEDLNHVAVSEGLAVTDGGGLTADVAVGIGSAFPGVTSLGAAVSLTCEANKDNYVGFDLRTGAVFVQAVALAAAEPVTASTSMWIALVTTGATIAAGSITDKRVTTSLDGVRIDDDTVDTAQMAPLAITTSELDALSVTEAKIDALAVTSGKIGAGAVVAGKIAVGGVSASNQMANGVVDTAQIAANAIDSGLIAANAVEAGDIAAAAVEAGNIAVGGVSVSNQIANAIVDTAQIAALAVTSAELDALAVTAGKVAVGGISASNQIANSVVDTAQIAALAVSSAELDALAVTAGKVATGGISASVQIASSVVGVQQSLGADVRSTINRNSHFLQYTRG